MLLPAGPLLFGLTTRCAPPTPHHHSEGSQFKHGGEIASTDLFEVQGVSKDPIDDCRYRDRVDNEPYPSLFGEFHSHSECWLLF